MIEIKFEWWSALLAGALFAIAAWFPLVALMLYWIARFAYKAMLRIDRRGKSK